VVIRSTVWRARARWLRASLRATLLGAGAWLLVTSGAAQAASGANVLASPGGFEMPDCIPSLMAGSQTLTIDVNGTPREVIVHIPQTDTGMRLPAVVAFHGYSSFARDLEDVAGLSALADEEGFVVAYPQALGSPTEWFFTGNRGYDQRDFSMTESLLRMLVERACVDPDRIVLAGHSMGGGMASDAACRLADQVAGVVLVAALWFELPCEPVRPVTVIAMHALDDPVLPYAGGTIGGVGPGVPEQLPVEMAMAAWAERDGCGMMPVSSADADGAGVLTWPDCTTPVMLYRLPAGGHDWPGAAAGLIAAMATAG
jgi:polyhydroxybutyrate depolymerase